jgi:carbonic anhydrase
MSAQNSESPSGDDFLPERLVAGYDQFLRGRFSQERDRFRQLAEQGQNPSIMLIGCCDSRVSPEVLFDSKPGEIFVARNVAALVPPYQPDGDLHGTSAALEFAIMGLKVQHVVVMGHAMCGGIKAFAQSEMDPTNLQPLSPGDFIGKWMSLVAPAARRLSRSGGSFDVEQLARESIVQSLANLRTFPGVQVLEARGYLKLHGAYFLFRHCRWRAGSARRGCGRVPSRAQ